MNFKVAQKLGPISLYIVIGQIFSKMARREFFIFIIFSDACTVHVLMLRIEFEPILIKIGFLRIFKVTEKSGHSPCTIVQSHWPKFVKNSWERILHFYNFFLMHIHVLMLFRKFEPILIKIGFFLNFSNY